MSITVSISVRDLISIPADKLEQHVVDLLVAAGIPVEYNPYSDFLKVNSGTLLESINRASGTKTFTWSE